MAHGRAWISQFWRRPSTQVVDIFVENRRLNRRKAPPAWRLNKTTEISAAQFLYKSRTCAGLLRSALALAPAKPSRLICVKRASQFRAVAQIE